MAFDREAVTEALKDVRLPPSGETLGGALKHAAACDGVVSLKLHLPGMDKEGLNEAARAAVESLAHAAGRAGERLAGVSIEFVDEQGRATHGARWEPQEQGHRPIRGLGEKPPSAASGGTSPVGDGGRSAAPPASGTGRGPSPQDQAGGLPGVRCVIAVGAGKGGVGKSTVAVNLAVGLARRGHAVGILDGDIYGPSLPTMLGLDALEPNVVRGKLQPFAVHGVKAITLGKLVEPDKPLIWRGPMAHGAFKQLAEQADWGELDYLIVDLPPGTGDVPLTMAQTLRLTGAVVVCTPQKVAQDDATRAAGMFGQLGVHVLGVVENMSYFVGDDGKEYDIFGRGGAERMAGRLGVPFLGSIPITMSLRESSDSGDASANFRAEEGDPRRWAQDALVESLESFVTNVEKHAVLAAMRLGQTTPTLTIS